jgi:hypothetical protein
MCTSLLIIRDMSQLSFNSHHHHRHTPPSPSLTTTTTNTTTTTRQPTPMTPTPTTTTTTMPTTTMQTRTKKNDHSGGAQQTAPPPNHRRWHERFTRRSSCSCPTDSCWIPVISVDSGAIPVEFTSQIFGILLFWYLHRNSPRNGPERNGTGMDRNGMAPECSDQNEH